MSKLSSYKDKQVYFVLNSTYKEPKIQENDDYSVGNGNGS